MSETTEKYTTTNDDFDLKTHIEQELIKGSYDRLLPIIKRVAKLAESNPPKDIVESYVQLESLSLELAQFALEYYAVKNEIDTNEQKGG